MTAFTPNTGGIVNWDTLTGGSVNATLDTYTISNNTTLLIDTDTYQCANHTTAFGSLDTVSFSGIGGKLKIDGSNVRVIPFNTGTGTVPAIGTSITQGGVSATLLGVWSTWQTEPLAAAAAMPATGFIKVKNKAGGNFATGALTGISASATGSDVVGWIEVRGADTAQITVPRIGEFEVVGDWFSLGTTTGVAGQVLACPTTATVAGVFPGVQIETSPGSGVYEWYASVGSLAAAATTPTDSISGKIIWSTTSGIRIGSNGTNTVGYLPPSGCNVRIPNVILTCCTRTAGSGSGPRVLPNATLATRQEYVTTAAGKITISKCVHQWYGLWAQPYQVTLSDSVFNDIINISEQATSLNIQRCCVAPTQAQINTALILASCFAGGTVSENYFVRYSLASSGSYIASTNYITNVNFSSNKLEALAARGNATTGAWTITQSSNCSWNDNVIIGGRTFHVASSNPTHTNTQYIDTFNATTIATNPMNALDFTAGTAGAVVNGFLLPLTNKHPYNSLVNFTASYNSTVKNIGSAATPLSLGSANQSAYIINSGGNNANIKCKRLYCSNTRTGVWAFINSDSNILLESVAGDYADTTAFAALNSFAKGCWKTSATTGQVSVYGTHWIDEFTAATTGRIIALMNEPTPTTISQFSVVSGNPRFNSSGQVILTTVGDQVILEMPYFAKAHTAAQNVAPTITGTNAANHTFEFQYDNGTGYNGSWLIANQTNWNAIGVIDPGIGIKLKLRITCSIAAATNAITQVMFPTASTITAQTNNLYPIDTAIVSVTALDASTSATIQSARVLLRASSGSVVTITSSAGTATVTQTSHGYSSGDKVVILGANEGQYNGLKTITVVDSNSYTYTVTGSPTSPATGTINSYRVILDDVTNASGFISSSVEISGNIPVIGTVRKGTSAPYYKPSPISGTITSSGLSLTSFLVQDG